MTRSINQAWDAPILVSNGNPVKYHLSERDRKLHIVSTDAATRYKIQGTNDETLTNWDDILFGVGGAAGYTDIPDGYQHYRLVCTTPSGGAATVARYLAQTE